MNRKPFDHIDHMFREAAENFQPPVTPQAWEKMEQLLDKSGRKRRPVFWYWPLLLILLTGGAGVYFFQGSPVRSTAVKKQQLTSLAPSGSDNKGNTGKKNGTAVTSTEQTRSNNTTNNNEQPTEADEQVNVGSSDPASTHKNINQAINSDPKNVQSQPTENAKPASDKQFTKGKANRSAGTTAAKTQAAPVVKTSGKRNPASRSGTTDRPSKVRSDASLNTSNAPKQSMPDQPAAQQPDNTVPKNLVDRTIIDNHPDNNHPKVESRTKIDGGDSAALVKPSPVADSVSVVKKDERVKKAAPQKIPTGIYYIVSLSGDGNGIKQFSANQISVGYGITLGYQLNRKWSVQAGLSGSEKNYSAGGKDYYFKPGSYYDTVNMRRIDAACYIVEIPVSLRYNFIQKNKSVVYAVAGLSSYIMKKEAYDYYYTYHNTWPSSPRKASYTYTDNRHFFSVVNLSAGYERKLSPRLSLQAEPYVKIPLSGVGEGKVRLYSAGMQLSFKWQKMKTIPQGSR